MKQAQSNLNKIVATEKEVAAAGARVESAKAALELAEIQVRRTELKAPFNGCLYGNWFARSSFSFSETRKTDRC